MPLMIPEGPMSKKELREACSDTYAQTKIKLRTRWKAPLFYKVLQTFQLNNKDRKEVAKILAHSTTPHKALNATMGKDGWGYRSISMMKDYECGVLLYKGLAVCLFYKRQVNVIEPEPNDPVPIGALESEDDIWARLDLFSKSPRQLMGTVREEFLEYSIQIEELKQSLAIRDMLITNLEKAIEKGERELGLAQSKIKVLDQELSMLKRKSTKRR